MADETTNKNKVQLLFKEFTGVVNSKQDAPFPLEGYAFKDYILNDNILSDSIPATLPNGLGSAQLDASSSIINDTSFNLASFGYPQLTFHKKRLLQPAVVGSLRTWYLPDGNGGSLLKNAISFKFDPINNSYNYSVYQQPPIVYPSYLPVNMYTNPTFWLFDFKSGFLEFYAEDDSNLNSYTPSGDIDISTHPPSISFFQYVGNTGGGGGGGGTDASFNNLEVSGNLIVQKNNLMQSYTSIPWTEPTDPIRAPAPYDTYYIIATVDKNNGFENPLGYFTLQLGIQYKQVLSFYAGIIESGSTTRPFIKIISNTNQEPSIGFQDLQIIEWPQPSTSTGTYYLVTTFKTNPGGGFIDTFKVSLTNNNGNGENIIAGSNPDWMLRNEDPDWNELGPQPPATKAPWTTNPSYLTQPLLPPAEITVPLTNHGGGPYGLTTQPEYFLNDAVFDSSGRIVAGNGTGKLDIVGNLYVDLDASFNQNVFIKNQLRVFDNTKIDNELTVGQDSTLNGNVFLNNTFGNTTIDGVTFIKNQLQVGESIRPLKIAAPYDDYLLHINAKTPFGAFTPSLLIEGPHSTISDASANNTQLTIDASGGVKFLTDIDMDLNDISNVNVFDVSSISANEFFQKTSKSSILDFSSVEITLTSSLNYFDVASILPTTQDISANKSTQASALVEIYLVMYDTTGYSPTTDYLEYLKCEISEFRGNSASINVLSAANIPNGNTAKILDSLRILYGHDTTITSEYYDPGALFQIGLKDSFSTGTKQQKLFYRIYQNNPIDLLIPAGGGAILTGQWQISLSNTPNNSPQWRDKTSTLRNYETTHTINLDFNPNAGSTGGTFIVNGGGKLMYVNDKDTKFTSNVKFEEAIIGDISFNDNVDISGNLDVTGDISGTDLTIDRIQVRKAYGGGYNIFGTGSSSGTYDPSGLVVKNSNDSLFVANGWNYVLGGEKVILTSGTVIKRTSDLSNKNYILIDPQTQSPNPAVHLHTVSKPLLLDTSGSTVQIKVNSEMVMQFHENYNEDMVGHNFYRPTTDISNIVIGQSIPTGTEYINNKIGTDVKDQDNDSQVMNQEVPSYWMESGWNDDTMSKYAKQIILMGSELKFDIFNAYMTGTWTGASSFGAFPPYTTQNEQIGNLNYRVWDSSYNSVTASLGVMTALYRRTNSDSKLIPADYGQKVSLPRDGWLTGVHLDRAFGVNSLEYIFQLSGTAVLQVITSGLGKKIVSGSLQSMDHIVLDTVDSSNLVNKIGDGWRIDLEPKNWVFLPKGIDLSQCLKLRMVSNGNGVTSTPFSSSNKASILYGAILDSGSYSENWSQSAVQGYMTVWCPPRQASLYKNY